MNLGERSLLVGNLSVIVESDKSRCFLKNLKFLIKMKDSTLSFN